MARISAAGVGVVEAAVDVVFLDLSARKRREWKCEATLMRVSMECVAESVAAVAGAAVMICAFAGLLDVDGIVGEEEKERS